MRRHSALAWGGALLLVLALLAVWLLRPTAPDARQTPIVIGHLQDLGGPLQADEAPLLAGARLAVEEINRAGGLLGRPVELALGDTRSDAATAAAAAQALIEKRQAVALFGCWTAACRDAVRPVVERHRHLLFHAASYEGLEQSPHLVYTGATPNQLALPATAWALQQFGRRIYLLGSEGPYSRRLHVLLGDFIRLRGGDVVATRYLPRGASDAAAVARELRELRPDVVLNTLGGASNAVLFDALVEAGLSGLPLLSLKATEPELRAFGGGRLDRHFTATGYLQSLPGPANAAFLAALRGSQGEAAQASDPAVSLYIAIRLWAAAVRELGSPQTDAVNANVLLQVVEAPQGYAAMDPQTRHLWRPLRVAQVGPDGRLQEVMALPRYVKPAPWPGFRSVEYWRAATAGVGGRP